MSQQDSYTGYQRQLRTRLAVRLTERVARYVIALGGAGTVVAVFGVSLFLAWVVAPLFLPGDAARPGEQKGARASGEFVHFAVDEFGVLCWRLRRDGVLELSRLDTGEVIDTRAIVDGARLSAWSFDPSEGSCAFGFRDGSVQSGRIAFQATFPEPESLPENIRALGQNDVATHLVGVIQRTSQNQLRWQQLSVALDPPVAPEGAPASVVALDHVVRDSGPVLCVLSEDGRLRLKKVRKTENLFSGEIELEVSEATLPFERRESDTWPIRVFVSGSTASVYCIWADGRVQRFDTRDVDAPRLAESLDLIKDAAARITAFTPLLGRTTLMVGDSRGTVAAWFLVGGAETPDGMQLVNARRIVGDGNPVTALAASPRSRLVAAGYRDGTVALTQVTSERRALTLTTEGATPLALTITPKTDGIAALTSTGMWHWRVDPGHPEVTLSALFLPVWYEGYSEPSHAWQSTGGTDDFEPKFGLWPLVFGTLKATAYSLLFGVPVALLAAIYTSEFLSGRIKTRVKTLIEFMASLPSVVLGFLAALVLAPVVQGSLPEILVSFLVVPTVLLGGAYLWQLLPNDFTLRYASYRVLVLFALLPVGGVLSLWLGPPIERLLFSGDIMSWLDGEVGSGWGGWVYFLMPISAGLVALCMNRYVGPRFRARAAGWSRGKTARLDLVKFLCGVGTTVALALLIAGAFSLAGWDPRGEDSLLGTYVQRNALIVGFVMGFAVIPIVYTIAEDALSAVPQHLRAASYGAGATQWQTAIRVVLPTAMSGLFSAVMVGLGRAVGETMIVLMAAGNTPVLDMNPFNGFRTLSANIAVELPEAVRDSTHYRTLFLAAFLLFLMTFVVNTFAESVRLRFRKRAFQL